MSPIGIAEFDAIMSLNVDATSLAPPVVWTAVPLGKSNSAELLVRAALKSAGKRVCHDRQYAVRSDRSAKFSARSGWSCASKYQRRHGYYPGDINTVTVHSAARIESAGCVLVYELGATSRQIVAPRGYTWSTDNNGIRLVRRKTGADYHPTAYDLIDVGTPGQAARHCAAEIRRLVKVRRENERQARRDARMAKRQARRDALLTRQAQQFGVYICFADSRRAGNCAAGTQAFSARHELDVTRHYSAEELSVAANRDMPRVKAAIAVALRRTKIELERGYSLLADHRS